MDDCISIYKNKIWDLLDEGSQLYIITMIIKADFKGECKLTAKIVGDTTTMFINDKFDHKIEIPINILDILND